MNPLTLAGVTVLIVLICAAIGTMTGVLCDQTRHHRWALTVTITVTAALTITSIVTVALWWQ
jgi:CHASE2 domain-containing sensor protein